MPFIVLIALALTVMAVIFSAVVVFGTLALYLCGCGLALMVLITAISETSKTVDYSDKIYKLWIGSLGMILCLILFAWPILAKASFGFWLCPISAIAYFIFMGIGINTDSKPGYDD